MAINDLNGNAVDRFQLLFNINPDMIMTLSAAHEI